MIARLHSTSARLAFAVTASFLLAFALLGLGVYYAVSTMLVNDTREVVRADAAGLMQLYRDNGRDALVAELNARTTDPDDPDMLYALFGHDGRLVVGTPVHLPAHRTRAQWLEFHDRDADDNPRVLAYLQAMADGDRLLTGLRMRPADRFLALMLHTALAALVVAAMLGALIGWSTTRWVSRRLRSIDQTAARVGAGELALRASVDGSGDAFDRLSQRFNTMLDRIEDLLGGVRHATDHIAHDLRTPLTRLRNRLELLRERRPQGVPQPELDAAITETDQLLQSFGALLRLARIEAQAPMHDSPVVDLQPVARDALEMYVPIAAERGITLRDATVPLRVRGDADQLFQLLVNLLDNAVKFAAAGSEVSLSLANDGAMASLEVADRGPGIAAADHARVLDRFVRIETHRGSPGTGLGLSVVRAIVLRHEGRIELIDNAPGLRVRVSLPYA